MKEVGAEIKENSSLQTFLINSESWYHQFLMKEKDLNSLSFSMKANLTQRPRKRRKKDG